jgi:hypothetical protein
MPKTEKRPRVGLNVEKNQFGASQGCQIFLSATHQNKRNIPSDDKKYVPNGHKIYQMDIKYTKWT